MTSFKISVWEARGYWWWEAGSHFTPWHASGKATTIADALEALGAALTEQATLDAAYAEEQLKGQQGAEEDVSV